MNPYKYSSTISDNSRRPAMIIPSILVIPAAMIHFRITILSMGYAIYPGLKPSPVHLFLVSLPVDMAASLVMVLLCAAVILPLSGRRGWKASWIAPSLLLLSLWLAIEFFRVYETPFHPDFTNSENLTGAGELARSFISEITLPFIMRCLATPVVIYLVALVFRGGSGIGKRGKRHPLHVVTAAWILLLFIGSGTGLFVRYLHDRTIPGEYKKAAVDMTANPVMTLLWPSGGEKTAGIVKNDTGPVTRLDTSSISLESFHRDAGIPRGKRYNIILYFFESTPLSYLDISVNGRCVTPSWKRLEKNSFVALNHYANYPLSASAMLSVLGSAYEHWSRDHVIQKYSRAGIVTLPEILKKHGYRTCVIHTGDLRYAGQRRFLSGRGIDRIIEMKDLENRKPYNVKVGWGLDERVMIEPSVEFLKEEKKSPFFIAYFPANPHHPYAIPDDSFRITGGDGDRRDRIWNSYLNSLHYSDAVLGMLVDRLRDEGLLDDTLLFVFADHGEAFYQHRKNYNHPFFLYEENVHVPFMIYNEKLFPEPVYFSGTTSHIDILPTILDVLSIDGGQAYEGRPMLSGRREQMALLHTHWKDDIMGVRDGRWKYMRYMESGDEELYDILADPGEKNNLARTREEIVRSYREYVLRARRYNIDFYSDLLSRKTGG